MLPFLRWVFGREDEADTSHSRSDSPYNNYAIPNNSNTFTRTIPPCNYTSYSNSSSTAQTSAGTHSQTSFNFTPKSNTPFAYNQQRETRPKVTVKVDSVISPKITPIETHSNVISRNTINPYEKSSHGQSSSSSSNLPFEVGRGVLPPVESHKSVSSSTSFGASPSTTTSPNLPSKVGRDVLPPVQSPKSVSSSSSFGASPSTTKSPSVSNKLISSRAAAPATISQDMKNKYKWVEKGSTPLYANTHFVYNQQQETIPKVTVKVDSAVSPKITPTYTHTNVFPKGSINPYQKSSTGQYLNSPSSDRRGMLPPVQSPKSVSSSSSFGESPSTPKSHSLSNKLILARTAASTTKPQDTKNKYIWVEKGSTPLYVIPEDIQGLIKKDIVPGVLRKHLSPETYKDYFGALLYAEDYYLEKWDGFEMKNVPLKLHEAEIYSRKGKSYNRNDDVKDDKIFVEFEIDSIPEKRPFLLSRDFASVRPCGKEVNPFKGIIFRVVKSNIVLVEFGDDFHAQHYSSRQYDVKFSFNRVCLKRAHQAIAAASDMLFTSFLFPECIPKDNYSTKKVLVGQKLLSRHILDSEQVTAVSRILNHNGSPPYLVEGPISVTREKQLSRTGMVVREAVVELCQASPDNRILICAPLNSTCDVFLRSLRKEVGDSNIFRANAAFRELDGVPTDVLPFCPYQEKEECFSCPSLPQLLTFKVILSTFMSSFRLHNEGIEGGHFSHIFLVDASSSTEPEILVPLTNLTNEFTKVVVTGARGKESGWVRSNIARLNGLRTSYFDRLRGSDLYSDHNPESMTKLKDV